MFAWVVGIAWFSRVFVCDFSFVDFWLLHCTLIGYLLLGVFGFLGDLWGGFLILLGYRCVGFTVFGLTGL